MADACRPAPPKPPSRRSPITLDDLRRLAVARSLFPPVALLAGMRKLGFVQADPIRAPARAQDLILRHRVLGYRAGDLERAYPGLPIEEDFFVNYGFLPREVRALMHPRRPRRAWDPRTRRRARALLEYVRARGTVHPREVDAYFAHGQVENYWGGISSATTHLLDDLHYRGKLRVARREGGVRVYAMQEQAPRPADARARRGRVDALVDLLAGKYGPLPAPSLRGLVSRLRYAVPQWTGDLEAAVRRASRRLTHARAAGVDWYWSEGEPLETPPETVRLLAPFDPVVWDRRRFELLWGWRYRFEAYTPVARRTLGYYALPLLWRDAVIGWANVASAEEGLRLELGYVSGTPPRDRAFRRELEAEIARMEAFLG